MLGREVATLPVRRVSGSEPLSLRTHRHRGRSRPLRSTVVEDHGSVSSGLTPTLREDWACKRAFETPCHARIAPSPQDPTAMSPDHWSKLTWDTVSAGGYDLPISYLDRKRDRSYNQRVIGLYCAIHVLYFCIICSLFTVCYYDITQIMS